MNITEVNRGITKNKSRKRIGRGIGSGTGKTAGRGHKGAGSRNGNSTRVTFTGGNMPLVQRIPKRGFNNRWALKVVVVNLGQIDESFEKGEEVTLESLAAKNLASRPIRRAEGAGRRRAEEEAEDLGPPLQRLGQGKDRKGRRRNGLAAGTHASGR